MARSMTTKSGTRRWPQACMFNMIDLAAINAFILFKAVTGQKISRRKFMKQLIEEMILHSSKCCETSTINTLPETGNAHSKRHQCSYCRNKTSMHCNNCEKLVCGKCSIKCISCIQCNWNFSLNLNNSFVKYHWLWLFIVK